MRRDMQMYCGECFGTFLLVLFGTATVAVAVLFNAFSGLLQIALVWGVAVTLAIYATRHVSCAHLNPAVSLAMVISGRMHLRLLPGYWISQVTGGVLAGMTVLLLFNDSILQYEAANQIVRGAPESIKTAMLFGEYFPNPGNSGETYTITLGTAMLVEAVGTFLLVTMIFLFTEGCNVGRPDDNVVPVFIGATVTGIISIFAPLTQAGINPARDFGPRLVAYFAGWDQVAIPDPNNGFFWVYILAPLMGATFSALCFRLVEANIITENDAASVNANKKRPDILLNVTSSH